MTDFAWFFGRFVASFFWYWFFPSRNGPIAVQKDLNLISALFFTSVANAVPPIPTLLLCFKIPHRQLILFAVTGNGSSLSSVFSSLCAAQTRKQSRSFCSLLLNGLST